MRRGVRVRLALRVHPVRLARVVRWGLPVRLPDPLACPDGVVVHPGVPLAAVRLGRLGVEEW